MLIFQHNPVRLLTDQKKIAGDFNGPIACVMYCGMDSLYKGGKCGESLARTDRDELFRSDMRIVVDYLAEGDGYRSDRKIVHKGALIRMIKVLSGETDTDDVEKWLAESGIREEDEITVCELFDQYERKGKAGQMVTDIENAMKFFKVTLEKACEGLGTTVENYEAAKKLL